MRQRSIEAFPKKVGVTVVSCEIVDEVKEHRSQRRVAVACLGAKFLVQRSNLTLGRAD